MRKVQAMMAYPNSFIYFLDSISEDLVQCYDCCLEEENLTTSQRQAIITLVQNLEKTILLLNLGDRSAY